MATSEAYKCKFPPTKLLDACYSDVVPDKSHHHNNVELLETALSENSNKFASKAPYTSRRILTSSFADHAVLSERICELRNELTNQIAAIQRNIHLQEDQLDSELPAVKSLIKVSQESPAIAACVLGNHTHATPTIVGIRRLGRTSCAGSKGSCEERALPFSRFCLKHITHDCQQVLYRSCLAIDKASLTQCREPVLDILSEESHCPRHSIPVGGDNLSGGRPPPRKKFAMQQAGRPATGRVGGAGGGATKQLKKSSGGRVLITSSKETTPTKPHPLAEKTTAAKASPSETGKRGTTRHSHSRTLDDLLTLSPALPAPVPTLDLVPLKADIGEIMMAGESSSSESATNSSDNEEEGPTTALTHPPA